MQVQPQQFTGKQYLQIDIAGHFGLDKKTWDERLHWFATHEDKLEHLLDKADAPAQYFAAVTAWRAVQRQEPVGYPIALDATASGLQLLACLTGDRLAAQLCNVVNIGERADAYTGIYNHMLGKVGRQGTITRDMAKEAVMTSLYGSEAIPKKVFGTGPMLGKFYETMEELAPAAWQLNTYFRAIWDDTRTTYSWVLPDNFHVHCKVMDKEVETVLFGERHYEVVSQVHRATSEGRSLGANTVHSLDGMVVREMSRRCNYNPNQVAKVELLMYNPDLWNEPAEIPTDEQTDLLLELVKHYEDSGYLSARILDCIHYDNAHLVPVGPVVELLDSLPKKPFEVFSIHDAFRCLPNYGNDLRQQYRLQLHLIAKSKMLGFLLGQLLGHECNVAPLDPTLADDILLSEYALS